MTDLFPKARHYWKPPFRYEPDGTMIVDANNAKILDVRGWGHLCGQGAHGLPEAAAEPIQDQVGYGVARLLNGNW